MKQLTAEQINNNWKKVIQLIKDTFEAGSERREKLLTMYQYFESRMMMAPASAKEHFHNAFPGGYVEHILHVVDFSIKLFDVWEQSGSYINFTKEELVFAALHHDLGKVGDLENDYYIPNDSTWHRQNQGLIYKHNTELQYMKIPDRSLWLLQQFGITVTEKETLGIKLADGLYDDTNSAYLKSYNPDWQLRSNLPHIIHQADMMASRIEHDEWKYDVDDEYKTGEPAVEFKMAFKEQQKEKKQDYQKVFDDLFGVDK